DRKLSAGWHGEQKLDQVERRVCFTKSCINLECPTHERRRNSAVLGDRHDVGRLAGFTNGVGTAMQADVGQAEGHTHPRVTWMSREATRDNSSRVFAPHAR